jgi:hypothetical protein
MRYALRAIAILTGFATGIIAAATVADARMVSGDPAVVPGNPSAAGLPLWQFLAFVALVVLLAVAIGVLGYSMRHSGSPGLSRRSQQPLTH